MPLDKASVFSLLYLFLPVFIFFGGWFKPPMAALMLAAIAAGINHAISNISFNFSIEKIKKHCALFTLILVAATLWSCFGGAGHLFFANSDWPTRDAVLRDLVLADWPPSYSPDNFFEKILRAPIAYYLPAAALAKIAGLESASFFLLLWTIAGVFSFFSLLPLSSGLSKRILFLTVIVLFSGLDIVGWCIATLQLPTLGQHLEWWAQLFQYSSNSTQLFWVPNHALPAWIAIALFLRHWRHPDFLQFSPMLFAALPLWSPFAAIGMAPFYALLSIYAFRGGKFYSFINLAPAITILVISGLYLMLDASSVPAHIAIFSNNIPLYLLLNIHILFILLEFGFLCTLLGRRIFNPLLVVSILTLILLPLFSVGSANDLVMRASIPALMLISISTASYFNDGGLKGPRSIGIALLLIIGALTPFQEFYRALSFPHWPFNPNLNLIQVANGLPIPHYLARLNQPFLIWAMKTPATLPAGSFPLLIE